MRNKFFLWWTFSIVAAFAAGVVATRTHGVRTGAPAVAQAVYVCPMHPQVVRDRPDHCPICGMALASGRDTDGAGAAAVRIAPAVVQNLGVRTTRVARTTLRRRIETPGFIQDLEPTGRTRVVVPFDGRVTRLYVVSDGWVEQGQPLVTLESETLRAAEQAHVALLAPDGGTPADAAALAASRRRLDALGLSADDVRRLEQERAASATLTLHAPLPGKVARLELAEGEAVASGTALFELTGLVRASVLANAFQRDAAWIETGQPVEIQLPHVSGEPFAGVVNQAAVSLDPSSQNIGVRLSFTAPAHLVKSAMYVVGTVYGDVRQDVLAVPQEALIRTATEDRVVVARGAGRFEPVPVRAGIETDGQVEIVSGLREGDEVVVSGQFLIDSESNLQASFRRLSVDAPAAEAAP